MTYEDIFPILAGQVLVGGLEYGIIEGVRLRAKHGGSCAGARLLDVSVYSVAGSEEW